MTIKLFKRKKLFFLIRIFISFAIILYLFSKIDFEFFMGNLDNINFFLVIFVIPLFVISILLISLRSKLILKDNVNYQINYSSILKYYLMGFFFNSFLPGEVSGDLIRAYKINKIGKNKFFSLYSVIIERFLGLFSLLIFLIIFLFFYGEFFYIERYLSLSLIIIFFIFLLLFILMISKFHNIFRNTVFLKKFVEVLNYVKIKTIFYSLILSLIIQSVILVFNFVLAQAVGIELSFLVLMPIILITTIILSIPLSFHGVGIREGVLFYFLDKLSIPIENILLFGLSVLFINVLLSIVGWILYIRDN